jgi:hypothetical protein
MKFWQLLIDAVRNVRLWDLLVGWPAGMVTFMITFLVTRLYPIFFTDLFNFLILYLVVTYLVSYLIGLVRFRQAASTALVSSLISAGFLIYLWLSAFKNDPTMIAGLVPSLVVMVFLAVMVAGSTAKKRAIQ